MKINYNIRHICFSLLVLVCFGSTEQLFSTNDLTEYHQVVLDNEGRYQLYWKIDQENNEIIMELHGRTLGWLGIGLSPKGGMQGADIVVAGLKDGQPYLYDMHADSNSFPMMDDQQNYQLMFARENKTHTVVGMKRKLSTCDDQDWKITNDTVRLIWAMNQRDADSPSSFMKHQYQDRGTRSVILIKPKIPRDQQMLPSSAKPWDLRVSNVEIPSDYHTLYHCSIFKAPEGIQKHHMLKYEPLIQKGNEPYLHHMVIYHCLHDMEEFVDKSEPCFNRDHTETSAMYRCTSRYMAGWAIGGGAVQYTQDFLGYPMFEDGASPYYMLEVHYDNSDYQQNIQDNSGMRLWITDELKPVEIGSITTGMKVNAGALLIPPLSENFKLSAPCVPKCTNNYPTDGIMIINGFLHEHLSGKAVRLRHYRDGVELAPIFEDNHYDFNYQEQRASFPPRNILRNDTLVVECEWDTSNKQKPVYGGFGTIEEMCFIFLDYYPRTANSTASCVGGPVPDSYIKAIGATKLPEEAQKLLKTERDGPLVTGPWGSNITLKEYADAYPWTKLEAERAQQYVDDGQFWSACSFKDSVDVAEIEKDLEEVESGELRNIEKFRFEFEVLDKLPQPSIPYTPIDECQEAIDQGQIMNNGGLYESGNSNAGFEGANMNGQNPEDSFGGSNYNPRYPYPEDPLEHGNSNGGDSANLLSLYNGNANGFNPSYRSDNDNNDDGDVGYIMENLKNTDVQNPDAPYGSMNNNGNEEAEREYPSNNDDGIEKNWNRIINSDTSDISDFFSYALNNMSSGAQDLFAKMQNAFENVKTYINSS